MVVIITFCSWTFTPWHASDCRQPAWPLAAATKAGVSPFCGAVVATPTQHVCQWTMNRAVERSLHQIRTPFALLMSAPSFASASRQPAWSLAAATKAGVSPFCGAVVATPTQHVCQWTMNRAVERNIRTPFALLMSAPSFASASILSLCPFAAAMCRGVSASCVSGKW